MPWLECNFLHCTALYILDCTVLQFTALHRGGFQRRVLSAMVNWEGEGGTDPSDNRSRSKGRIWSRSRIGEKTGARVEVGKESGAEAGGEAGAGPGVARAFLQTPCNKFIK